MSRIEHVCWCGFGLQNIYFLKTICLCVCSCNRSCLLACVSVCVYLFVVVCVHVYLSDMFKMRPLWLNLDVNLKTYTFDIVYCLSHWIINVHIRFHNYHHWLHDQSKTMISVTINLAWGTKQLFTSDIRGRTFCPFFFSQSTTDLKVEFTKT